MNFLKNFFSMFGVFSGNEIKKDKKQREMIAELTIKMYQTKKGFEPCYTYHFKEFENPHKKEWCKNCIYKNTCVNTNII